MKKAIVFVLFFAAPLAWAVNRPMEIKGFSFANLYVYVQYGWFYNIPCETAYYIFDTHRGESHDDYFRDSDQKAVVGAGYTVFNLWERLLADVEYDYSRLHFSSRDSSASIIYHNLGINFSYWFSRRHVLGLTLGMGLAFMEKRNSVLGGFDSHEHYQPLWASIGFKYKLWRGLLLRTDVRFFSRFTGYRNWDYWDEYDREYEDFGTCLAVGLEWHLK